ncbi:hypothetical protein DSO57_1013494 [Entomophthora muscae]|uniref:Uncharacterized protein n=1 Tax=Entomophthora muscae TaxID=34485 RepID=A0ACC2SUI2_9FUNG|nr:hypothetical protein DSO57_1013494 [Entomophthora muscae]
MTSKFEKADSVESSDEMRKGSNLAALFSIVCLIAGAGTLGMPYSFRRAGWVAALFIPLSGAVAWYTGKLIIECLYCRPGTRLNDYPSVGEAAFGKWGRRFVMVFHYAICLGVATLFIMLSGKNLHSFSMNHGLNLGERSWIAIAGVAIFLPYALTRSMKETKLMATLGVLTTVVTVLIACGVGFSDLPRDTKHHPVNLEGVPTALATIGFSFGGTVIYTHVEGNMRHPKKWPQVLAMALGSVSLLYLLMGIVGYAVYGESAKSPILESLTPGYASDIAFIIITLHLIAAAPLPLTSFSSEVERQLRIDNTRFSPYSEFFVRLAMRTCIIVALTLVAAFIPYFGDFMALVGALSNLVLVYVTPVICHLQLFGWKNRSLATYFAMTICLLMGFFGGAWGAVDAITSIVKNFATDHSL